MPADNSEQMLLLSRLADEFAERYREGKRPPLQEYIDRYPDLADDIREFFPALVEIEQVKENRRETEPSPPAPMLERIGDYRIVREIGRGGMGVVYEAVQISLGRPVALKVLPRQSSADERATERFRREARAAGRLHHTNIVPVFEVGVDDGTCYYAMQLIAGQPLDQVVVELRQLRARQANRPRLGREKDQPGEKRTSDANAIAAEVLSQAATGLLTGEFCPQPSSAESTIAAAVDRKASSPASTSAALPGQTDLSSAQSGHRHYFRSVARIGQQAAAALAYAHARGVIHRDIKPSNLMLDAFGVVWITDFGLARTEEDGLTATGDIVGTLRYMAPERFNGEGDARADIYALGATLYELLVLQPAFDSPDRLRLLRQIQTQEPLRPRILEPRIPRDLETIVLTAMSREPKRRYRSADEMAADLERFAVGEPIRARRVGELERAMMWARRSPVVAVLLAAVVFALLLGTTVSTWFAFDAREQARLARQQESAAIEARNQAQEQRKKAEEAGKSAIAAENAAKLQAARLTFQQALHQAELGAVDRGLFLMLEAWRQAPEEEVAFRRIIRTNLAGWSRQLPRLRLAFRVEKANRAREIYLGDPEGQTILTCLYENNTIRCWDVATGRPTGPTLLSSGLPSTRFISPDGRWVGVGDDPRPGRLLDRVTGKAVAGLSWPDSAGNHTTFHDLPDVLLHNENGEHIFWELPAGTQLPGKVRLGADDSFRLTRTVGGRPVAVVFRAGTGADGRVEVVDLRAGKGADRPTLACGLAPFVSYDGRLAAQLTGNRLAWWDLGAGRPLGMRWQVRRGAGLALTNDGLELTCSGVDHRQRPYDPATGLQRGGDLVVYDQWCRWSPDGRLLITLDGTNTVRVWDTSLCRLQVTATSNPYTAPAAGRRRDQTAVGMTLSADHSRLALTWKDWNLGALFDVRTGELLGPPLQQTAIDNVAFSADGRHLATATYQSRYTPTVVLRDGRTGQPIGKPWICPRLIWQLAFSPDGKTLAVAGVGGTHLLDVPDLTQRHHLPEATCNDGLLFHRDNRRLAVRSQYGWSGVGAGLRIWDASTGKPLGPFRPAKSAFAPRWAWDGDELVTFVSSERVLHRLSSDGKEVCGGPWDTGRVDAESFSPDGTRMAASSFGVNVRQWDTRTGKPAGATLVHQEPTSQSLYSSDSRILAVVTGGKNVVLWDAESGWALGPPLAHPSGVDRLAFTDQDRTLLTVTSAGVVHAWPVPLPVLDDPDRFEAWLHARGGRRLVGQETVDLTLEEWQAGCRDLEKRWPGSDPALAELSGDLSGWHRERALHALEVGNDRGELYHLTRLTSLRPREPLLHSRVAALYARVAAGLPEGEAREHLWQLAWAAAKRDAGQPGEADFKRLLALTAAGRKSWDEALWYLDQLVASHESDWGLLANRADVHAGRGDRASRDADLRRAIRLGGDKQRDFVVKVADLWASEDRLREVVPLLSAAIQAGSAELDLTRKLVLAQLNGGDHKGHAATCQSLLRSLPVKPDPGLVVTVLDLCALSPETLSDWSESLQLSEDLICLVKEAEQKAKGDRQNHLRAMRSSWLTTKGALLHRAGKHKDALTTLEEALKLSPEGKGEPSLWAWLALTRAAQGGRSAKEAQAALDKAKAGLKAGDVWDRVSLKILIEEARRAIRGLDEF